MIAPAPAQFTTLSFEPRQNGTVVPGQWQTWTLGPTSVVWQTNTTDGFCVQATPCTLADFDPAPASPSASVSPSGPTLPRTGIGDVTTWLVLAAGVLLLLGSGMVLLANRRAAPPSGGAASR